MHRKTMIVAGLVAAAVVFLHQEAYAQAKTEVKDMVAKGTIKEIDTKDKTLTITIKEGSGAGKDKTLEVAGNTKIDKGSAINLHLKDLKEGDEINVMYKKVKEPSADKKSMVEMLKALKITVLNAADTGATNATSKTTKP
jgi:Cu/Ag efflux protein CusF